MLSPQASTKGSVVPNPYYKSSALWKAVLIISLCYSFGASFVISAQGEEGPKRLRQYGAWTIYSHKMGRERVCYALAQPLEALPATVRHGNIFFSLNNFSSNKKIIEPQFMADYPLQSQSNVKVTIKNASFRFFTKSSSAWLASEAQERQLVSAMRKGAMMKIEAISKRGTHTSYVFSLDGVSKAIDAIKRCN